MHIINRIIFLYIILFFIPNTSFASGLVIEYGSNVSSEAKQKIREMDAYDEKKRQARIRAREKAKEKRLKREEEGREANIKFEECKNLNRRECEDRCTLVRDPSKYSKQCFDDCIEHCFMVFF